MEFTFLRVHKVNEDDVFIFRREIDDLTFFLDSHERIRPLLDVSVNFLQTESGATVDAR